MCGICGYKDIDRPIPLQAMMDLMAHRGPDQTGAVADADGRSGLGHRRLNIVDLTDAGRQPMMNESGSIFLVHNGEIYNHQEIRKDLQSKGHRFTSRSDSEVILHAYEEYGTDCLKQFNGMFAFAVYDRDKDLLFLARDRFGIKPCYYMRDGNGIIFASEIKPLLLCQPHREINPTAVYSLLTFQFSPETETIAKGIYNLPPGHFLILAEGRFQIDRYYGISENSPVQMQRDEAANRVWELLTDAVRIRLMGDVSLGVLLSGGLDSSAVVACATEYDSNLKTYTVGFGGDTDEFDYARQVADKFKTDHEEVYISPATCLDEIERIAYFADLPLAEAGLIPIYLISNRLNSQHKILLFGEGSDEYMGGYPWHKLGSSVARLLPMPVLERFFFTMISQYQFNGNGYRSFETFKELLPKNGRSFLHRVIRFELENRLPHNHLLKIDRMTMAHSIEGRVPFLDHRLVEFVFALDNTAKVNGFTGKSILREAAGPLLPKCTTRRSKVGFKVPFNAWFWGELKDMCTDLLMAKDGITRTLFPKTVLMRLTERQPEFRLKAIRVNSLLTRLVFLELWHRCVFKGSYLNNRS